MKRLLLILLTPLMLILTSSSAVYATSNSAAVDQACSGLTQLNGGTNCHTGASTGRVNDVARTAINILSLIVGIAAVIVIIISGFRFITSGGDTNTISSVRTQIIYAIIGLVIVAIAQVIARWALHIGNKVNGVVLYFPHIKI